MIRSSKKLELLAAVLERKDNLVIAEAVNLLRDELPFEGAIGLLTALYNRNHDQFVRRAVEGFMNDIKDQSAGIEVMAEINKDWESETLTMLVASCWQSGLDYTGYLTDFALVFTKCDYLTAIECFTVIEESAFHISLEKKQELVEIIRKGSEEGGDEKQKLTSELIRVLSSSI